MTSFYQPLFTIVIRHDYFLNDRFGGFTLAPFSDTRDYLFRKGMLLRVNGAEIKILAEIGADPELKLKQIYADQYHLKFALNITDGNFFNYTDGLSGNKAESVYYFSNVNDEGRLRNDGKLHADEIVGVNDAKALNAFNGLFFARPFAVLDMRLSAENPAEFQINFKAKSTYWKYIIVSSHLHDYENLSVLDGQEVSFEGPEQVDLQNRQRAVVFRSKEPIKLSEKPSRTFSLVDNYTPGTNRHRVLKRTLPAPNISTISAAAPADKDTNFSEIFI